MTDPQAIIDAERTMREEKWLITNELFDPDRPEPPDVAAFRALQEDDWLHFMTEVVDNDAMKFFNPERREYSSAADWEALAKSYGIWPPYKDEFSIPATISEEMQDLCRQIRQHVRHRGSFGLGGCNAFHDPREVRFASVGSKCVLVICHDGGALAPYFNPSYEDAESYQSIDYILRDRNLWREGINPAVTAIYSSQS
jgi:hypothetical protein